MSDAETPESSIILYQTEDGRTRVQCRLDGDTIWLTQALISELFQVTPQNVTLHLKAIYDEGELDEGATGKDYLQVRSEGGRHFDQHDADVGSKQHTRRKWLPRQCKRLGGTTCHRVFKSGR